MHTEAVNAFSALLADLIRAPDFSWKEAKKILKKDSRYEALTGGEAALDKSERERLFDTHIDELIAKKKTAFRSLLEEQKEVALDAAFKVSSREIENVVTVLINYFFPLLGYQEIDQGGSPLHKVQHV